MKFGIIGYGSIGKRHVRNLIELGQDNIILLRAIGSGNEHNLSEFTDKQSFLEAQPDVIIIANPTSLHAEYINQILLLNKHVIVEKPLVATLKELMSIKDQIGHYKGIGMTAYNMHYHPCVIEIKNLIKKNKFGKIYYARFFVGQYLPDWRPGTDYSKSYSSKRDMGGGVLFDLIHEIDLACNLIGNPVGRVAWRVDKVSDLEIETEDLAELFYHTKNNCLVSIHLDYLTFGTQRYIEIIGEKASLKGDLFSNSVTMSYRRGEIEEKHFRDFSTNDMYLDMLSSFINCIKEKKASPLPLQNGFISNQISINIRDEFYNGKN